MSDPWRHAKLPVSAFFPKELKMLLQRRDQAPQAHPTLVYVYMTIFNGINHSFTNASIFKSFLHSKAIYLESRGPLPAGSRRLAWPGLAVGAAASFQRDPDPRGQSSYPVAGRCFRTSRRSREDGTGGSAAGLEKAFCEQEELLRGDFAGVSLRF